MQFRKSQRLLATPLVLGLVLFLLQFWVLLYSFQYETSAEPLPDCHSGYSQSSFNTTNDAVVAWDGNGNKKISTQNISFIQPRAFDVWPSDRSLPCFPSLRDWRRRGQVSPSRTGFLMNKLMKVGGSTAAGVNLRIARNQARRHFRNKNVQPCKMRNGHVNGFAMRYAERFKKHSFLWSMIRDPTKRIVSHFFHFVVARMKVEPTDDIFRAFLNNSNQDEYYLKDMTTEGIDWRKVDRLETKVEIGRRILQDYDFIGVTERFDESIVVLKMLLGVEMADVLFLDAKGSGGFDGGGYNKTCYYIPPNYVSPAMKEYFASPEWTKRFEGDLALYDAVNRSLDLTIDKLGRDEFQKELAEFRAAQKEANDECLAAARFPCSPGGERQVDTDCILGDSGCGVNCLDRVSKRLGLFRDESLEYF